MRISRHRFYLPAQRFNVFSAVFYRNRCTSTFRDFERPGPKLGPAPESARKDPRAAEKSVHMSKKNTYQVHNLFIAILVPPSLSLSSSIYIQLLTPSSASGNTGLPSSRVKAWRPSRKPWKPVHSFLPPVLNLPRYIVSQKQKDESIDTTVLALTTLSRKVNTDWIKDED